MKQFDWIILHWGLSYTGIWCTSAFWQFFCLYFIFNQPYSEPWTDLFWFVVFVSGCNLISAPFVTWLLERNGVHQLPMSQISQSPLGCYGVNLEWRSDDWFSGTFQRCQLESLLVAMEQLSSVNKRRRPGSNQQVVWHCFSVVSHRVQARARGWGCARLLPGWRARLLGCLSYTAAVCVCVSGGFWRSQLFFDWLDSHSAEIDSD